MIGYLKRLARTGAAYTTSSVLAKLIAIFTLPVYTRYVDPGGFGQVEILATTVIVLSIFFRFGAIEAMLRFYFLRDEYDPREIVRTGFWGLLAATTLGTAVCLAIAPRMADWLLGGGGDALTLVRIAIGWFWFYTIYELLLALFRVDERAGAYAAATVGNVLVTVPLTVYLVVVRDLDAQGLLLGNAIGTTTVTIVLLAVHARRIGRPGLPLAVPMLRFGLPTVPGEISLYALNWVDRLMLLHLAASHTAGLIAAGLYSIAFKFAQGVTVFVRAFQLAWPPLAYSIKADAEARVVYGRVLTYYLLVTGGVVAALALVARWLARLLVSDAFFLSYRAVPLVATGVVLYGAYLVLVSAVARVGKTGSLFPIAAMGLAANAMLCYLLIPLDGWAGGIVGAGLALIGAYVVLLSLMYLRARAALGLVLEFRRLAQIVVVAFAVGFGGEQLLPADGIGGLLLRTAWWSLYPIGLLVTGFFSRTEIEQLRNARDLLRKARQSRSLGERPDVSQQVHGPE
ncbi:MAG: oligosaccharide flippase family protein [Actinobacteria bacterium]|nr:oligosaccharide flippase family protein [Actinomycetota bacterium]